VRVLPNRIQQRLVLDFSFRHAADFNPLQRPERYAMNKSSTVSLASLAALLLAGSALAQTVPGPSGDAVRADRRCTSATLSTDSSTPCSDDVVNTGASPVVVRAPANSTAGSVNTSTGTSSGGTGTASTGTTGNMGAGSTAPSMGGTGMRR